MTVTGICPICGTRHQVAGIDPDAYRSWQSGTLAQHAFPNLDIVQREQLITRICPDCQQKNLSGGAA